VHVYPGHGFNLFLNWLLLFSTWSSTIRNLGKSLLLMFFPGQIIPLQRSWGQEVGTWIQALNLLHAFISLSLVIIRDKMRMDKQWERQNNSCKKFHFIIRRQSGRVCCCLQPYIRHVNHLHLHIWTFYLYIYILVVYIYTSTLTSFCVNVWECVKCIYLHTFNDYAFLQIHVN